MCAFVVLDLVSSVLRQEIGYRRTCPKSRVLCRVGRKTLTQSINQSINQSIRLPTARKCMVDCIPIREKLSTAYPGFHFGGINLTKF